MRGRQGTPGGYYRTEIRFGRKAKLQNMIRQLSELGFWDGGDGNHRARQFAGSLTKMVQFLR